MPRKPGPDPELIRLAIAGIDAEAGELQRQLKELQEKKVQFAKLTGVRPAAPVASPVKAETGGAKKKRRKMSPEARKKLAIAAKARWAKVKASGKKKL